MRQRSLAEAFPWLGQTLLAEEKLPVQLFLHDGDKGDICTEKSHRQPGYGVESLWRIAGNQIDFTKGAMADLVFCNHRGLRTVLFTQNNPEKVASQG